MYKQEQEQERERTISSDSVAFDPFVDVIHKHYKQAQERERESAISVRSVALDPRYILAAAVYAKCLCRFVF